MRRLLIRLSVIPSLKYSVFGSALECTKGKTATESIVSPPRAVLLSNQFAEASDTNNAMAAAVAKPNRLHEIRRAFGTTDPTIELATSVQCAGALSGI